MRRAGCLRPCASTWRKDLRAEAAKAQAREAAGIAPALPEAGGEADKQNVSVSFGGLDLYCKSLKETGGLRRPFRKSLRERCERLARSDGSTMGKVVRNVPRAMFLFPPLLAATKAFIGDRSVTTSNTCCSSSTITPSYFLRRP